MARAAGHPHLIGEAAAGHPFTGSGRCRPDRAHLHRCAAARRSRCRRHPGECHPRRRDKITVRDGAPTGPHAPPRHRLPRRRRAAGSRAAARSARGLPRCRHGPWRAAGAPQAARRRPVHRRRAGGARRQAGTRARSPPPTIWAWRRSPRRLAPRSHLLGIARDTRESLEAHIAKADGTDVIVTIGGASVGDHDLVAPVLEARGMALSFWNIAMRPGKPLMFGRLGKSRVLGLPGNPVSSLVCRRIFLVPLMRALLGGRDATTRPAEGPRRRGAGGQRTAQHYMRATSEPGGDGQLEVTPVRSQDSSLLAPLAQADCLLVRPPARPRPCRQPRVDPAARLLRPPSPRDDPAGIIRQTTCGTSREQLWCSRFVRLRSSRPFRPACTGKPC